MTFLEAPVASRTSPLAGIPRPPVIPLSCAQERLWSLDQLGVLGPAYNHSTTMRVEGELDLRLLQRAVSEVSRRHEILRMRYPTVDGSGRQVIEPAGEVEIEVTDLSSLAAGEKREKARQLTRAIAEHEFDLARECPFRVYLLRLSGTEHLLIIKLHYMNADCQSFANLLGELVTLYKAYRQGQASPLPELSAQYADYALWQRNWLNGLSMNKQLAYWKARLAGVPQSPRLPTDRTRPAIPSYQGGLVQFKLTQALCTALNALTRQDTSLFMVLLAIFQILLSRWSGQQEVFVGTPSEGRDHHQTEKMIGYFLNPLVLRANLSTDSTFSDHIEQVRASLLDAYEYRDLPFEKLVEALCPAQTLSYHPLYQVSFTYVGTGLTEEHLNLPDLKLSLVEAEDHTVKVDLSLTLLKTREGLEGGFEYATDLFDRATIERLAGYYKMLLEAAATDPGRHITELPLLSEVEP